MTMSRKQFSKNTNHLDCYGGFMGELGGYDCFGNKGDNIESDNFRCDQSMSEQEDSRTESTTVNEAVCSSSKDEKDDENWLQLGTGINTNQEIINKQDEDPNMRQTGLVELNLLPESSVRNQIRPFISDFAFPPPSMPDSNILAPSGYQYGAGAGAGAGFTNYITASGTSVAPLLFHQGISSSSSFLFPQQQEVNWAFRPVLPRNLLMSSSSTTSSPSPSFMPQGLSYMRQSSFQYLPQSREVDLAGPSFDYRIIDPPRRQHSGIWFILQASQNQERTPILPQVPKSYLKIKDGRMTVRLLIKYLVNKLRLDNESEIEIRCRGERLQPNMTLQLVRDTIWNNNTSTSSNTISSPTVTDHIMVLQYARS